MYNVTGRPSKGNREDESRCDDAEARRPACIHALLNLREIGRCEKTSLHIFSCIYEVFLLPLHAWSQGEREHLFFHRNNRKEAAMLIAYDSKTGNVKRFAHKLRERYRLPIVQIDDTLTLDEPYVLVTYTTGFGQAPLTTTKFLERSAPSMIAVAASGNKNWGASYGRSADTISAAYRVPLLHKFELSGTMEDLEQFAEKVKRYETH